jgi:hypothetical protein
MQECSNWTAAASNSAPICAGVCTVNVEKEQSVEKTANVGFVFARSISNTWHAYCKYDFQTAFVCTVTTEKKQQVEKTDNVGFAIASSIYNIYGMLTCLN